MSQSPQTLHLPNFLPLVQNVDMHKLSFQMRPVSKQEMLNVIHIVSINELSLVFTVQRSEARPSQGR